MNGVRLPAIGLRFSGALPDNPGVNANNRFLNMGTELSRHANVLQTETVDIYAGATWVRGAHELKFGFDYVDNKIYNLFSQNVNGNYTFAASRASAPHVGNCTTRRRHSGVATLENFRTGGRGVHEAPLAGRTLDEAAAIGRSRTSAFLQERRSTASP